MLEILKPLVVDLDRALVHSSLLLESYFLYIKSNPFRFYRPLLWYIYGGSLYFKENVTRYFDHRVENLPYNRELMEWLYGEKKSGRQIILATTLCQNYAERIAQYIGLFDQVLISDKTKNNRFIELFGKKGFDYVGCFKIDLELCKQANNVVLVTSKRRIQQRICLLDNVSKIIDARNFSWKPWIKELRLYQWVKNLLIFFPYILGHYSSPLLFLDEILAFLFFSLCASSVYLLNDLLDLQDDRQHIQKKYRPLAEGTISNKAGLLASIFLLLLSCVLSLIFLPLSFFMVLLGYYLLTLNYSIWLKRIAILDVVILALLYSLRIIAGAFLLDSEPTFWILAFSLFIFFSLSLIKRYTELREVDRRKNKHKAYGRGYYSNDLEIIASFGIVSGYLSVLVLSFYIQDKNTALLYHHPQLIWLACPVFLFWISRIWLLAHRGQVESDPILFILRDRISYFMGIFLTLVFFMAF